MPTYVLLTKLSVDTIRDLSKREEIGKKWHETVKKKCPEIKFISHYALLMKILLLKLLLLLFLQELLSQKHGQLYLIKNCFK